MTQYILVDMSSDEMSDRLALTNARNVDHAEQKFRDSGWIDDGKSLEDMQMEIWPSSIAIVE